MGWRNIIVLNSSAKGSTGWSIALNASAIREEQIAFVGGIRKENILLE